MWLNIADLTPHCCLIKDLSLELTKQECPLLTETRHFDSMITLMHVALTSFVEARHLITETKQGIDCQKEYFLKCLFLKDPVKFKLELWGHLYLYICGLEKTFQQIRTFKVVVFFHASYAHGSIQIFQMGFLSLQSVLSWRSVFIFVASPIIAQITNT